MAKFDEVDEAEQTLATALDNSQERRSMDPELRTMGQMLRMLENLSRAARARIVAYLVDRFCQGESDAS
jgi:hypothetical protein